MQPSLTNLRPDSASQCVCSSLLAKNYREVLIHGQPEQVLDGVDALVDARLDEVSHVLQCKKVDDVTSGIEPVTTTSSLNQKILTLAIKISLII